MISDAEVRPQPRWQIIANYSKILMGLVSVLFGGFVLMEHPNQNLVKAAGICGIVVGITVAIIGRNTQAHDAELVTVRNNLIKTLDKVVEFKREYGKLRAEKDALEKESPAAKIRREGLTAPRSDLLQNCIPGDATAATPNTGGALHGFPSSG